MFEVLLSVGKVEITWLEALAFVLALGCVLCNILEIHWGWPLAIISCALYALLFFHSRLYGDAALQAVFAAASVWGWWQWLKPSPAPAARPDAGPPGAAQDAAVDRLRIRRLSRPEMLAVGLTWVALWLVLGWALSRWTDSDVAWADAFPTAGGLIGQVLLGRKVLENWAIWQVVNICMIGLLAYKGLWLTVLLYGLFLGMAVAGWRRWSRVSA